MIMRSTEEERDHIYKMDKAYRTHATREYEREFEYIIGKYLWGMFVAAVGVAAVMLIFASCAQARHAKYYPTPAGATCADVRQKQAQYGFTSIVQAKAFAASQGILVTASQERQILSCLRGR